MKTFLLVALLGLSFPVAVCADETTAYPDRVGKVLDVGASVKLTRFSWSQELGNVFTRSYSAEWSNKGEKAVAAFELRVLRFNPFDEALTDFVQVIPGTNSADYSPLAPRAIGGDGFNEKGDADVFTALAFVSKVRFADGSIWRAMPSTIEAEQKKVLPNLGKPAPMLRKND